jgi:anaerobic selenocysteine-containing dehydrogenase
MDEPRMLRPEVSIRYLSIFNERGSVVTAAYVTERMMPGVVHIPNGAGYTHRDWKIKQGRDH